MLEPECERTECVLQWRLVIVNESMKLHEYASLINRYGRGNIICCVGDIYQHKCVLCVCLDYRSSYRSSCRIFLYHAWSVWRTPFFDCLLTRFNTLNRWKRENLANRTIFNGGGTPFVGSLDLAEKFRCYVLECRGEANYTSESLSLSQSQLRPLMCTACAVCVSARTQRNNCAPLSISSGTWFQCHLFPYDRIVINLIRCFTLIHYNTTAVQTVLLTNFSRSVDSNREWSLTRMFLLYIWTKEAEVFCYAWRVGFEKKHTWIWHSPHRLSSEIWLLRKWTVK